MVRYSCPSPNWQGDGYCDDENNIEECGFDLGDCCEEKNARWDYYCKECRCRDPDHHEEDKGDGEEEEEENEGGKEIP